MCRLSTFISISTLTLIILTSLTKCGSVEQTSPGNATYSDRYGNQVVFLDNYFHTFLAKAKADNQKNISQNYTNSVVNPVFNNALLNTDLPWVASPLFSDPVKDLDALENTLRFLEDARAAISDTIFKAIDLCHKEIDTDLLTVYIVPANPRSHAIGTKLGTASAATPHQNRIMVAIDPNVDGWLNGLGYVVSHEYYHAYWLKHHSPEPNSEWTLLDYLIFEGKADYFASLIFPNYRCKWTESISTPDLNSLWEDIRGNIHSPDQTYQRSVMFGDLDKYPFAGGYALGYRMVRSFIENQPPLSIEDWSGTQSSEILEMSNFSQRMTNDDDLKDQE